MIFKHRKLRSLIFLALAFVSSQAPSSEQRQPSTAHYELRGIIDTYDRISGYAVIDGERYSFHSSLKIYASPRAGQSNNDVAVTNGMSVGYTLSHDAANAASLIGMWILPR